MAFQLPRCVHIVCVSVRQSVSVCNDSEFRLSWELSFTLCNENAAFPCLATLCSIADTSCVCDTIALEHSAIIVNIL